MINKKPVSYKNRRIITTSTVDQDNSTNPIPVDKPKKGRSDKGKPRVKYDTSLPSQYLSYLKRANRKGISFDFTPDTFDKITSEDCSYCGGPGYGIDRVDSSKGYTVDNSVPCCTMCNMMKYTHSKHVFLKHIKRIHEYNN